MYIWDFLLFLRPLLFPFRNEKELLPAADRRTCFFCRRKHLPPSAEEAIASVRARKHCFLPKKEAIASVRGSKQWRPSRQETISSDRGEKHLFPSPFIFCTPNTYLHICFHEIKSNILDFMSTLLKLSRTTSHGIKF